MNKDEFKELLVENNKTIFSEMDKRMSKRFENNNKMIIDEMNKRFDQMEQKRIDDNFYFEHTYGEKISIIFDKLQLMDDIKNKKIKKNKNIERKLNTMKMF